MTDSTNTPKADTAPQMSEQEAIAKSYTDAQKQLRENHLAEFNDLRKAAAKVYGYDWTPKPTEAEKAAAKIEDLLAEHPELRAQFGLEDQPSLLPDNVKASVKES